MSSAGKLERRERVVHDVATERRHFVSRASDLVWLLLGTLEALLALRVLLKVMGANPANVVAEFIYNISAFFVGPFSTLVSNPARDGVILEVTSLLAMLVYALAAWVVVSVLLLIFDRPRTRTRRVFIHERDGS